MPEMITPGQLEAAAAELTPIAGVLAADVLDRDPRINRPLLELTVGPQYQRVPPRVLRAIAEHDLGVRMIEPHGDYHIVEVV